MSRRVYSPAHHRAACGLHVLAHARQRGIAMTAVDVANLEKTIDRLRPAFERPGRDRYWLTVRRPGGKIRVVYDTRLQCLVTILGDLVTLSAWHQPRPETRPGPARASMKV